METIQLAFTIETAAGIVARAIGLLSCVIGAGLLVAVWG